MKRLALAVLFVSVVGTPVGAKPPNIVFILVDDLGWSDLGCYGNRFNETPSIDRLAKSGVRFTDFYAACPVCSPTRASILSGQYQTRFSLTNFIPGHWKPFEKLIEPANSMELPLDVVTLAEALSGNGYSTAHFGKWHLGGSGHMPKDQGFGQSIVTSGRHVAPNFRTQPKVDVPKGKRLAEFLTDRAIDFMKESGDKPFFLHLSHYAVHIPLMTTPQLRKKYEAKPRMPGYPCNPLYAGLLEEVDASVARIVKFLDEQKLADNTLLVFTSDNGGLRKRFGGAGETATSNAPLRDEKGSLYEGGIRVPLLVRWPGVTKPGTTCDEPTLSIDFYPTFLEASGTNPPNDHVLDGVSLVSLLRDPSSSLEREALYWHYPHYHHSRPASAMRAGEYKAIEFFDTGSIELYDLSRDLGEKNDLAGKMPDQVRQMRSRLRRWRTEVNAALPQRNPAYDPKRADEWWSRRTIQPIPNRRN